jgi:hypothetical protein
LTLALQKILKELIAIRRCQMRKEREETQKERGTQKEHLDVGKKKEARS